MKASKEMFELGQVVILEDVQEIIVESKLVLQNLVARNLHFFSQGKWGKVDERTAWKNDMNIKKGEGRITGRYETPFGTLEIVTAWNRERTEIKFAE